MKQPSRDECEAMKRLAGDPIGRTFLSWIGASRREFLEKAFIEGARSEDKLANIEKAAVLTRLLEAVDEAPSIMAQWPDDEPQLDI